MWTRPTALPSSLRSQASPVLSSMTYSESGPNRGAASEVPSQESTAASGVSAPCASSLKNGGPKTSRLEPAQANAVGISVVCEAGCVGGVVSPQATRETGDSAANKVAEISRIRLGRCSRLRGSMFRVSHPRRRVSAVRLGGPIAQLAKSIPLWRGRGRRDRCRSSSRCGMNDVWARQASHLGTGDRVREPVVGGPERDVEDSHVLATGILATAASLRDAFCTHVCKPIVVTPRVSFRRKDRKRTSQAYRLLTFKRTQVIK